MRTWMLLIPITAVLGLARPGRGQAADCLTVRDAGSKVVIASAQVRVDDGSGPAHEIWTDTAGTACWSRGEGARTTHVELRALGYRTARRDHRGGESMDVMLDYVAVGGSSDETLKDDAWSQAQLSLALTLALRELRSCVALTTLSCAGSYHTEIATGADLSLAGADASAEARDRLGRVGSNFLDTVAARLRSSASPPSPTQRDSAALTLATFLDTPDAADRYVELRLVLPVGAGRALFGATEMTCRGTECDRARQVSFAWEMSAGHRAVPTLVMAANGRSGPVDVFHLRAPAASAAMAPSATGAVAAAARPAVSSRSVLVRGLVSDEKGHPVRDVQVTASPGDVESRTDSAGRYVLALRTDANAIVLTARALGYAPVFKTALTISDTGIVWDAQLRRFQLLAARVVTGKGVPAQLSSWRYDELMARRAQGRGLFMVGNEISSSSSIGDALARVPGLIVKMKYSNTITAISMSRCTPRVIPGFIAPDDRIGVWVNGIEQTVTRPAEVVLGDLLVADVIALEVYNGASMIPAEFTSANYCGVVSAWTK